MNIWEVLRKEELFLPEINQKAAEGRWACFWDLYFWFINNVAEVITGFYFQHMTVNGTFYSHGHLVIFSTGHSFGMLFFFGAFCIMSWPEFSMFWQQPLSEWLDSPALWTFNTVVWSLLETALHDLVQWLPIDTLKFTNTTETNKCYKPRHTPPHPPESLLLNIAQHTTSLPIHSERAERTLDRSQKTGVVTNSP